MTRLAFFVGKGGVGKTTLSAAYSLWEAKRSRLSRLPAGKRPVLLVSTDPAHSLADVLQLKLSDGPGRLPFGRGSILAAWEMNSAKLFAGFIGRNKKQILELIEKGSFFTADEIEPLLDTTLPGMAEMAGLLGILDAIQSGRYSTVVVDTAPFGHTLRLFQLPQQFSRLLNFLELAASRDEVLAEHFGGRKIAWIPDFIHQWRAKLARLQREFEHAELFLVTTPENFAVQESLRWLADLDKLRTIPLTGIVVNRVVNGSPTCARCSQRKMAVARTLATLRRKYRSAEYLVAEDPGHPLMGIPMLRGFADHVFGNKQLERKSYMPKPQIAKLRLVKLEWPLPEAPLCFVLGKGGVGKTTIAAGVAFRRRKGRPTAVEICSVDPAPSLDDIFEARIGDTPKIVLGDPHFRASEFDAQALFASWIEEIRTEIGEATSTEADGVHVDLSFERRLFSELLEIVPPGLDEIMAIFRIMDMRTRSPSAQVIIDMAPTGHALELLRMPERIMIWARLLLKSLAAHRKLALARNAAVKIAEMEVRARELAAAIKNSQNTEVFAVMLPEPLPDRETERLLAQLHMLNIPCRTVFVNRVILPGMAGNCRRCKTAERWQAGVLAGLKRKHPGKDFLIIRDFETEIAGRRGLRSLTKELWRLA